MNTSIKLDNCKCGEKLNLGQKETWYGMRCLEAYSYCPKAKWYNSWRHWKPQTHMTMPYPSVNKWKPEIEEELQKGTGK